jgi:ribonucleases P/MRP protein subunit RPP40
MEVFNLTTLETRRTRGDLIEVFKILMGYENVNAHTFLELLKLRTIGHLLKLFKTGCNWIAENIHLHIG